MYRYLAILILLASCTTAKKVARWNSSHPGNAAAYCEATFPVTDSLAIHDSTVYDTSLVDLGDFWKKRIDTLHYFDSAFLQDTVVLHGDALAVLRRQLQRPKTVVLTKVIYRDTTHWRTNMAQVEVLSSKIQEQEAALDNQQSEITQKNGDIEKLQNKLARARKINLWLYIAIGALLGYVFRKTIGRLLFRLIAPIKGFSPF